MKNNKKMKQNSQILVSVRYLSDIDDTISVVFYLDMTHEKANSEKSGDAKPRDLMG